MKNQIPIYVISINRTPERRIFIKRQLDTLRLEYQFVDVDDIDKYEMESEAYRTRIARSLDIDESVLENKYASMISHLGTCYEDTEYEKKKNSTLGQLTIILSHIKIYNLMIKNNIAEACILEDDATLLPTFPQVLKATPNFSYDILLLASQPNFEPVLWNIHRNYSVIKLKRSKRVLLIKRFTRSIDYHIEQLSKKYGFNHSKQKENIARIVQESDAKYTELIKTIILNNRWLSVVKRKQYRRCVLLGMWLGIYTSIRLGALPEKSSLTAITDYHYIARPRHRPLSTTAYLVKQAAAAKWKQEVLKPNTLAIDEIPWRLYKNEQIKLRLITLPCATATYQYLVYSTRRGGSDPYF